MTSIFLGFNLKIAGILVGNYQPPLHIYDYPFPKSKHAEIEALLMSMPNIFMFIRVMFTPWDKCLWITQRPQNEPNSLLKHAGLQRANPTKLMKREKPYRACFIMKALSRTQRRGGRVGIDPRLPFKRGVSAAESSGARQAVNLNHKSLKTSWGKNSVFRVMLQLRGGFW